MLTSAHGGRLSRLCAQCPVSISSSCGRVPDRYFGSRRLAWNAYVDYIGTDIFDWYGGSKGTYMHTASGALDHEGKWQQILTTEPGGLNWMAAFSHATGKPIIIPEWGLDFHTFGGKDNPLFITNMLAWMKAHHAIGLYWAGGHVTPASTAAVRCWSTRARRRRTTPLAPSTAWGS
jgi:hypothetical protein